MSEAPSPDLTELALFGMFRSGTNYVRTLVEMNYDCRLQNNLFGWKHGFYPSVALRSPVVYPEVPVVVVVKAPTLSLYSLHKYYVERKKNLRASEDFPSFLRDRVVFFDAFNRRAPEFRFANPVQMWNGMNWHYASIKPRGSTVQIVRYEDALADPERVATTLAAELGLQRSNDGPFTVPEQRTRNMADKARTAPEDYLTQEAFSEKDFYLSRGYLDAYSSADLDFVRREVDGELLSRIGYAEA